MMLSHLRFGKQGSWEIKANYWPGGSKNPTVQAYQQAMRAQDALIRSQDNIHLIVTKADPQNPFKSKEKYTLNTAVGPITIDPQDPKHQSNLWGLVEYQPQRGKPQSWIVFKREGESPADHIQEMIRTAQKATQKPSGVLALLSNLVGGGARPTTRH